MENSIPIHTGLKDDTPHDGEGSPSFHRPAIIAAVLDFYRAIIKLPYIEPNALVLPPPEGWSGVNVEELRRRGKTDEVIELLRYLPYLRNPGPGRRRWNLSPDTLEIAYCDGEMYEESLDDMQPTPPHCVWLTANDSRDGIDLLVDTQCGTITEWSMLGRNLAYDYEEYEKLSKEDKWMAFPTLKATGFLEFWKQRWLKLVWMPVYNPQGGPATSLWWHRAVPNSDDEQAIIHSDFEYEPDENTDDDDSLGGKDDGRDNDDEEGFALSDDEVDAVLHDAFGDKADRMRVELVVEPAFAAAGPNPPRTQSPDRRTDREKRAEQRAKKLYDIYKRNGWPSEFNREKCKAELEEFRLEGRLS